MILTTDERVELDRRVAVAMHCLNENDNVRDTLIDIYCEYLPDKERWQGEMMADKLIAATFTLKEQCANANDFRSDFIARQLEEVVGGMDNEAACKSLFALVEALKLLNSGTMTAYFSSSEPGKALEDLKKAVEERDYPGPYDLASRNKLIREAHELLSRSTMSRSVIDDINRTAADRESASRLLLEGRIQEDALVVMNAMILYTIAVDYPLTIEEAALAVCSREYIERACRDYRSGIITLHRCEELVSVMESVALLALWTLEALGILAVMYLAVKSAGPITAVLSALLMAKAFSELDVLMVEDMEKVFSKLSMNMYRKALTKHIRREEPVTGDVVEAKPSQETVVHTTGKTLQKSADAGLEAFPDELEEDAEILF